MIKEHLLKIMTHKDLCIIEDALLHYYVRQKTVYENIGEDIMNDEWYQRANKLHDLFYKITN